MSAGAAAKPTVAEPLIIGRYALFDELAAGGMATVHLGRLLGPVGFGRTVAVKRLHAHYLYDQEFVTMFMDEARVAARIRHPNVVQMVDVVQSSKGLFLVMDYVHGESLSRLMRSARQSGDPLPVKVVAAIMSGALLGLHAAHETKGATGELLGVVHRDVSPQNIIVGADGVPRVLDFGIAKAAGRAQVTREGQIKGKLTYMAPEQVRGGVDRRTDVFSAAVCLWEALAGKRLHEGLKDVEIITRVMSGKFTAPSAWNSAVSPALDALVLKGLSPDPDARFATAREMALELEKAVGLASPSEVSALVEKLAHDALTVRAERVSAVERASGELLPHESNPPPPSLALQPPQQPPQQPPMDFGLDEPGGGGTPITNHSAISTVGRLPPPEEKGISTGWLVVLCVSAFLAVIGAGLGGFALLNRRAPPPAPSAFADPTPPRATAPASSSVAPMPSTPSVEAGASTIESASSDAGAKDTPAPSSPPSASAAPRPFIPWTPPKPPKKQGCDPPYTTDDVGHKHYKPECFDSP